MYILLTLYLVAHAETTGLSAGTMFPHIAIISHSTVQRNRMTSE